MREITAAEVWKLDRCIRVLSEHHNKVSVNFKGDYPTRPYEKTLELFEQALSKQTSKIAVIEENGNIAGFCKIDISGENGKLDYLVMLEEHRGKGYGKKLMDWAINTFQELNVKCIEVKVVDGNEAIHLYEEYGFKMNAHILVKKQ